MTDIALSRPRSVFFFDIDNTLYPRSMLRSMIEILSGEVDKILLGQKVHKLMHDLINAYFMNHLDLLPEDANQLHQRYYKDYGLAISGLIRHHKVDPMDFNREVDDALPLDTVIAPNPKLRKLLEDLDRTKVKPWLFTNAHITHGQRVVKLLGVEDLFEGITFCDYSKQSLVCKPHPEMYEKAESEAGAFSSEECYFADEPPPADDSHLNCRHAHSRGWTAVHLLDYEYPAPASKAAKHQIHDLEELRGLFPQFFITPPPAKENIVQSASGFINPPTLM